MPPNPHDDLAIRNLLSLYCLALDTKDLSQLSQVFTPDVRASYPFPGGEMHGLESVQRVIAGRLHAITSQHALTTQHITLSPSSSSSPPRASATTYFSGVHFGQGPWAGQTCTAYGKYIDELVLVPGAEAETAGASGAWRVCERKVEFMARVGEEGIFMRD